MLLSTATYSNSHIHSFMMAVAAMQGTDQQYQEQFGVQ